MNYSSFIQNKSARIISGTLTVIVIVVLFVGFVFAVKWFRSGSQTEEEVVPSVANILTPDPISQAVIDGSIDRESRIAGLYWQANKEIVGEAKRGEKDDKFYLEIDAALPAIDRESDYYQVWLLRKIPYDYFSLGEMVTDDEGDFVFEWSASDKKDYMAYSQIIITLNKYEGSHDPGEHLVEGEFGE
jgi:hypothetical protein